MAKRDKKDRSEMKKKLLERTKKHEQRQNRSSSSIFKRDEKIKFWKCGDGEHIIDIIPYSVGKYDPFVMTDEDCNVGDFAYCLDLHVHYGIGENESQKAICLKENFNLPCPICEHRTELIQNGADEDIWKALFPKQRNIYNVICYDTDKEEEKGVQVWEVANFYMGKHLSKLAKGAMRRGSKSKATIEPTIIFADAEEGKSIAFEVEIPQKKKDETAYPKYIGHQFVDRDYIIDQEILDSAYCLDELLDIPTYENVYEMYYQEPYTCDSDEDIPEDDIMNKKKSTKETKQNKVNKKSRNRSKTKNNSDSDEEDKNKDENSIAEGECPVKDGEFGIDNGDFDECEECPNWAKCEDESEKDDDEEEDEEIDVDEDESEKDDDEEEDEEIDVDEEEDDEEEDDDDEEDDDEEDEVFDGSECEGFGIDYDNLENCDNCNRNDKCKKENKKLKKTASKKNDNKKGKGRKRK